MNKRLAGLVSVGLAIGALNLAHYFVTTRIEGVDTPFGLFPGGFPVAALMGVTGKALSPELLVFLVLGLGIVVGSILSACLSKELTLRKFRSRRLSKQQVFQGATGGLLMGIGIWMAQGCLIKHTLSGIPGMMLSSFMVLAGIMAGIWISAQVAEKVR